MARASLKELLLDYEEYLRQNDLAKWEKDHLYAKYIRNLAYKSFIEDKHPESAANKLICLIHP